VNTWPDRANAPGRGHDDGFLDVGDERGAIRPRRAEHDIAADDPRPDVAPADRLERRPQLGHWHAAVAADVDAAEERDPGRHPSMIHGSRPGSAMIARWRIP
jgi:hypothetical protein